MFNPKRNEMLYKTPLQMGFFNSIWGVEEILNINFIKCVIVHFVQNVVLFWMTPPSALSELLALKEP